MGYTTLPFTLPSILGPAPPEPVEQVDLRAWTVFDPNLRIDEHSNETVHTAVVTHLLTGMQESCGTYPHMIQNRAAAIAKLKLRVAGM